MQKGFSIQLVASRVRAERARKQFSQEVLADMAALGRNAVGLIERGEYADLKASSLYALACALDVSADYLLGLDAQTELDRMEGRL